MVFTNRKYWSISGIERGRCGLTKGEYIDQLNAIYPGEHAVPLGFTYNSLIKAIQNQPKDGLGKQFTAFVIPQE